MTTDPSQHDSESDERLERELREGADETETAKPVGSTFQSVGRQTGESVPQPHVDIEGYQILRELHRGGQGVVYEAVQKSTKRKVAIKLLLEGPYASASAKRRFQREVALAAGLKHPNIIAIFDSGETPDGHRFCVMDYVRGVSIRTYVRQNNLALEDALKLFSSACEAAHFAHLKGVIHRDLKPSNIIVATDGVPKVLDFGLAKQLAGGTDSLVSLTGQVVGTLPYMSPEQTRGNPDEIDGRTDVYALGVILYELLTGQHPYPVKGEMAEVLKHITQTEPTPPSKVWTTQSGVSRRTSGRLRTGQCPIDNELQTILYKALAKKCDRRYQTADALRRDLQRYLAGEPIEAKRDSSLYVLRKTFGRHKGRIAATVGAMAIALVTLFVGLRMGGGQRERFAVLPDSGRIESLAVLPLQNRSGDPAQQFFVDGMTDELITNLSKISALRVTPLSSVMKYKDPRTALSEISRELNNVHVFVTGSVLYAPDQVRITARLIDARSDRVLWTDSYNRDMRNILVMQQEVARHIALEIQLKLTPQEKADLSDAVVVKPKAYEAYVRGRFSLRGSMTRESANQALDYFNEAIELDSNYAAAYAGRADAYTALANAHLPPEETMPQARAAATKAIQMDETLAEAHVSLGTVKLDYEWDWAGAEAEFRRALELNPNLTNGRLEYAEYLAAMGRGEEALTQLQQTLERDPVSLVTYEAYGIVAFMTRDYDQVINYCRRAIKLDPGFWGGHAWLGMAQAFKGRFEEGIDELEAAQRLTDSPLATAMLGSVLGLSGNKEGAQKKLDELREYEQDEYVCPYEIATVYIGLDDHDQAFAEMDRACAFRSSCMPWLKVDPRVDPLRGDPRFDDLLRRVGHEVDAEIPTIARAHSDKIMLAVLPFEDMSPDPQEWFGDGMTGELIATLGKIATLGVISRTSAFAYKDAVKPLPQIARELNVSKLVEGSVLRIGGRVRIRVTLIDAATDTHLWSNSYERDERDVITLQNEVARAIAGQIQAKLTPQERARLASAPSINPEAYQAYLRALDRAERPDYSEENLRLTIRMFKRAVRLDPDFALAYAGLSHAHSKMHQYGYDSTEERSTKAKAAVDRAVEIQPDLPEAHLALGYYHYWCHRDYDQALDEFAVAEKHLPNDSRILEAAGYILRRQGNFNVALDQLIGALELSPRDPSLVGEVGGTCRYLRRYAEADNYFDRCSSLAPDQEKAYIWKAEVQWLRDGDTERARATLEEIPAALSDEALWTWFWQELFEREYQAALDRLAFITRGSFESQFSFVPKAQLAGLVYHLMGDPERARPSYDAARILLEEELQERPDDHRLHSSLGIVYAGLGRKEDAIREGKLGVELFPVSKDALIGPYRVEALAFIYTLVGEYDAALDKIEYLLSIPSWFSVPLLRLDPRWDPLRDHPRYKPLLRRVGFEPPSIPGKQTP